MCHVKRDANVNLFGWRSRFLLETIGQQVIEISFGRLLLLEPLLPCKSFTMVLLLGNPNSTILQTPVNLYPNWVSEFAPKASYFHQ